MRFANIIYLNKINFPGKLMPEKKGKKIENQTTGPCNFLFGLPPFFKIHYITTPYSLYPPAQVPPEDWGGV